MEYIKEIVMSIILLIAGFLMLIRPDIVWEIEHFLSVKNGEPTDWYLAITRIIGLGCIFIAILLLIVLVILRL